MNIPLDVVGKEIRLGDTVARASLFGNSPMLTVCEVTKVVGDKIWLDNSPRAIIYNDRIAIIKEVWNERI